MWSRGLLHGLVSLLLASDPTRALRPAVTRGSSNHSRPERREQRLLVSAPTNTSEPVNRRRGGKRVAVCVLGHPRTFLRPTQQTKFEKFLNGMRGSPARVELFAVFGDGFEDSIKGSLYRADQRVHSRVMRERWKATSVEWSTDAESMPCGGCWEQWRKFADCARAVLERERVLGEKFDVIIKTRPDLDYVGQAYAASKSMVNMGLSRAAMKTYKDDRLFSLRRDKLDDVANMYASVVASGRCDRGNASFACLGLMQAYLEAHDVQIQRMGNLAWIQRPVESKFFMSSGLATFSENNVTSWRDARNLTRWQKPAGCEEAACEEIQHLQCNATMCRLFFDGHGELPRQYGAPGMIGR